MQENPFYTKTAQLRGNAILTARLMSSWAATNGAEVCELIGLFVLDKLKGRFGYDIGLYRDDGIATLNTRSGRVNDKARKGLVHNFNDLRLNIIVLTNKLQTNFLDLTLTTPRKKVCACVNFTEIGLMNQVFQACLFCNMGGKEEPHICAFGVKLLAN